MNAVLNNDEIVLKVLNNNIVLINSKDKEKILFAKGIGFRKKCGDIVPRNTKIDKVFTIENDENRANLNELVKRFDEKFLAVCEEAIYDVSKQLDTELNERIHIALIDHLSFAIERLKNKEEIENPFLIETKTLYPKEFSLAKLIALKIEKYSNAKMPEGEIGFIALHIHSAINDGKLSNTIKNTNLSNMIVKHVEERLGIQIDRDSLDYARFCTHIKFAIQRIMVNTPAYNELSKIIKKTYKETYLIAEEISKIIERELKVKVTKDEIAFLTIHIERFKLCKKL